MFWPASTMSLTGVITIARFPAEEFMIRPILLKMISFLFIIAATRVLVGIEPGHSTIELVGGPLTKSPVRDAPFSAHATTTIHARLQTGKHLDQVTTMRFFRDHLGRVRVEQLMEGLEPAKTPSERAIRTIVDPDPSNSWVYMLDWTARTARPMSRQIIALTTGGGDGFAVPLGGIHFVHFSRALDATIPGFSGVKAITENLPPQQIHGIDTVGRRGTISAAGVIMVDERWDSPELELTVRAQSRDSRTGTLAYELTDVERSEPSAELFEVPTDFTLLTEATPADPWLSIRRP